ncbi:MAG: hypothetical protein BJ554DRAFT_8179, partial [Olpidium bornovanus]
MAVPEHRLLALAKVACRIFRRPFRPDPRAQDGFRVLSKPFVGDEVTRYYPEQLPFRHFQNRGLERGIAIHDPLLSKRFEKKMGRLAKGKRVFGKG